MLRPAQWFTRRLKQSVLLVIKDVGTREKADAFRGFDGKSTAPSRYDIDDKLRVPPVIELWTADVERGVRDLAEINIILADLEFAARVAHR